MTTDEQHNWLLDAVDQLTKPRIIHTTITDDDTGAWIKVHSEEHPPLLTMLIEGTGVNSNGRSSDPGIPIDADALEIWAQVRDCIRLWCRQLDATYLPDDLLISIRNWYRAHVNAHQSKKISDTTDHDVTLMIQGWVRMIENKFDPQEKREWTDACPAYVPLHDVDGNSIGWRRCGARRVVVGSEERFAISLNVTTMTAECCRCHTRWVGERGVMSLRYETNLWALERAETEAERDKALAELANDTPTQHLVDGSTQIA